MAQNDAQPTQHRKGPRFTNPDNARAVYTKEQDAFTLTRLRHSRYGGACETCDGSIEAGEEYLRSEIVWQASEFLGSHLLVSRLSRDKTAEAIREFGRIPNERKRIVKEHVECPN